MGFLETALVLGAVGIVAGVACTIAELLRPARPLAYREVVGRDTVAFIAYQAIVYPVALVLFERLPVHDRIHLSAGTLGWPLLVRVILYYLIADFGSYVLHRLMHTRAMWRVHKWHHAPKYMYWFAGVRATIPQQFMFNLPTIAAVPIIINAPTWVFLLIAIEGILRNDWMHMNVAWRSNWVEWIFVTPRYHAIHHSSDPHHLGNFGSLFSIWDRIFGTRIDPDTIDTPLRFGTGTDDNPIRVVLGV